MGRPRPPKNKTEVEAFLARVAQRDWLWLERIGPELRWVLMHIHGPQPISQAELSASSPWNANYVRRLRAQALHLLGFNGDFSLADTTRAERRAEELGIRGKLFYLSARGHLGHGDQLVVDAALVVGAIPRLIARRLRWPKATVECVFERLLDPSQFGKVELGSKVRVTSLRAVAAGTRNAKAALEERLLVALRRRPSFTSLGSAWGVPHSDLETIAFEVRRELASSPRTARAYEDLEAQSEAMPGAPTARLNWLNSKLLPLYHRFRAANWPFSERERRYLRLRAAGRPITVAAKRAMKLSLPRGSVIDRALLGCIPPPKVKFPAILPLPPFTAEQCALMERLNYQIV